MAVEGGDSDPHDESYANLPANLWLGNAARNLDAGLGATGLEHRRGRTRGPRRRAREADWLDWRCDHWADRVTKAAWLARCSEATDGNETLTVLPPNEYKLTGYPAQWRSHVSGESA